MNPVQPAGSRKAHLEEPGRRGNPGRWEEPGRRGEPREVSIYPGRVGLKPALSWQDHVIQSSPISKPRTALDCCVLLIFLHLIRMLIWFNGCIKAVSLWDLCLIHTMRITEVNTGVWQ